LRSSDKCRERCETAAKHNARIGRPGFSMPFRECAQSRGSLNVKFGDFPVEFDEGGGLKNRRLD
jgi:hypothetical protein